MIHQNRLREKKIELKGLTGKAEAGRPSSLRPPWSTERERQHKNDRVSKKGACEVFVIFLLLISTIKQQLVLILLLFLGNFSINILWADKARKLESQTPLYLCCIQHR